MPGATKRGQVHAEYLKRVMHGISLRFTESSYCLEQGGLRVLGRFCPRLLAGTHATEQKKILGFRLRHAASHISPKTALAIEASS